MSARSLFFVWASSIAMTAVFILACYYLGATRVLNFSMGDCKGGRHISASNVVVGTSLTGHAFPPIIDGPNKLLPERTIRWNLPNANGKEVRQLAIHALDSGAELIFFEAGPLVWEFEYTNSNFFSEFSRRNRVGLRILLGQREYCYRLLDEKPPKLMNAIYDPRRITESSVNYGTTNWEEDNELKNLVERVKQQGSKIILLSYPRAASSVIGSYDRHNLDQIHDAERELANYLGLKLFAPDQFWPDDYFADRSHLNTRGRERYMTEFSAWWAAQ
ncbi:MAG: SGNH/GDSL hydrolase family protein [Pseudomonadota bacterium]